MFDVEIVKRQDIKTKFFYMGEAMSLCKKSDAVYLLSVTHIDNKNSVIYSFLELNPSILLLVSEKVILMTPTEFDNDSVLFSILINDTHREIKRSLSA